MWNIIIFDGGEYMIEKNLVIERFHKSALEIIVAIIGIASITLSIIFSQSLELKNRIFLPTAVTILVIMSIYSAVIYKKEASVQSVKRKLHAVIRIIWNYSIAISLIFLWNKFFISKVIIHEKNYWIYNIIVLYFIISLAIKNIIRFLEERKKLIEEKQGLSSHFLNVLAVVFSILYFITFGFYWYFIPKKTLDLANAPKPKYLYL